MRRPHSAFAVLGTCLAVETLVVSPLEQWGVLREGCGRRAGTTRNLYQQDVNVRYSAPKQGGSTNRVELGGVRQAGERGVHATSAARPPNCQTVP